MQFKISWRNGGRDRKLQHMCRTDLRCLETCSSSRMCNNSDIETAYRIRDRKQRSDLPRPVIVRFHRWSDKMEVFNDTVPRYLLRCDGIIVSSELTTCQRDEVRHYRRQGKVAYCKNDRRQVEERQATPSVDSRREDNSRRHIIDDRDGRERTDHYCKHRTPQTLDCR